MPLPKKTAEALASVKLNAAGPRSNVLAVAGIVTLCKGVPELDDDGKPHWTKTEDASTFGLAFHDGRPPLAPKGDDGRRPPRREPARRCVGHARARVDDGKVTALTWVPGLAPDAIG